MSTKAEPIANHLPSYTLLRNLLNSLRIFYNGTILSYSIANKEFQKITKIERDYKRSKAPLYLIEGDEKTKVASNLYELESRFNRSMPQAIRKAFYIQIISILEAYLIEVTREIFINRRELFSEDGKIEFSLNEILSSKSITSIWSKIINKKCRQLQNQGFNEVRKFFSKNFSIDFSTSPVALSKLEYLHDRRHIVVHRLGKVDKQFEHKYNDTGNEVLISEADFYQALDDVEAFALFINTKAQELIDQNGQNESSSIEPNPILYFKIEWHSEKEPILFNSDFNFISEESVHNFSEIIKSYTNNENEIEIELQGPIKVLRAYQKEIKKYEKAGELSVIKKKVRYRALTKLKKEIINKIIAELPKRIDNNTYKEIASKLNLPQKEVKTVISFHLMALHEKKIKRVAKKQAPGKKESAIKMRTTQVSQNTGGSASAEQTDSI